MIIYLFRILLLIAIVIFIYTAYQYYHNPQRQLRKAKKNDSFFFLDDASNNKQNLQFVYKGCVFEGEKYLGTTDTAFVVVNINIIVLDPLDLIGFTKNDVTYLENEISKFYPHSKIKWKHPMNQLSTKSSSSIN